MADDIQLVRMPCEGCQNGNRAQRRAGCGYCGGKGYYEKYLPVKEAEHAHDDCDDTCIAKVIQQGFTNSNSQVEVVTPCPNCSHPLDLHNPTCQECNCVDGPYGFTNTNSQIGNE